MKRCSLNLPALASDSIKPTLERSGTLSRILVITSPFLDRDWDEKDWNKFYPAVRACRHDSISQMRMTERKEEITDRLSQRQ